MDCSTFAFDLHVLGTPPALILSQDQTLMFILAVSPTLFAWLTPDLSSLRQTSDERAQLDKREH
jgi:hypothetical protein